MMMKFHHKFVYFVPLDYHLNLTSCYFDCSASETRRLIDTIWRLPSLIYCYLNLILKNESYVPYSAHDHLELD